MQVAPPPGPATDRNLIDQEISAKVRVGMPPPLRGAPQGARRLAPLPDAIAFEYWQEADGSWGAHSDVLGVTAVADELPALFAEAASAVDEFWDVLNERYDTLSEDLRAVLCLRNVGLRFEPAV